MKKKLIFLLLVLAIVLTSCGERISAPFDIPGKHYTFTENETGKITLHVVPKSESAVLDAQMYSDNLIRKTDERIAELKSQTISEEAQQPVPVGEFKQPPITIIGNQAYFINDFTYKGTKYRLFERLGIENPGSFTVVEVHDK
jgi:hypothetical protein